MPRQFDPPLEYAEINRVYDFTTRLLDRLSMGQWRLQVMASPATKGCYASIGPVESKHVGELRLGAEWMAWDLETERIPTLVHEVLHLTHRDLTDWVTDDLHGSVGYKTYGDLHKRWERGIERWVDHMTQVLLGLLSDDVSAWAEELWGKDWRDQGSVVPTGDQQWCVQTLEPGTVHVWPLADVVAHELYEGCVCSPSVEEQRDGGRMFTHHSADGREQHEGGRSPS
ncbi:hypothetical protein GCM10009616_35900 [Microlunatus lacustris]